MRLSAEMSKAVALHIIEPEKERYNRKKIKTKSAASCISLKTSNEVTQ